MSNYVIKKLKHVKITIFGTLIIQKNYKCAECDVKENSKEFYETLLEMKDYVHINCEHCLNG